MKMAFTSPGDKARYMNVTHHTDYLTGSNPSLIRKIGRPRIPPRSHFKPLVCSAKLERAQRNVSLSWSIPRLTICLSLRNTSGFQQESRSCTVHTCRSWSLSCPWSWVPRCKACPSPSRPMCTMMPWSIWQRCCM